MNSSSSAQTEKERDFEAAVIVGDKEKYYSFVRI